MPRLRIANGDGRAAVLFGVGAMALASLTSSDEEDLVLIREVSARVEQRSKVLRRRTDAVYGDLQDKENKGGYNISIRKYLMNCSDKVFLLQKTYLFNGEKLIKYTKFDQTYYQNDPAFGWKELDTDKIQNKISGIFCK